jgi:peptidoglycan DL-endopeptidase LytE
MVARNSARFLAPVAILATIAGGYLIVHDNLTANHATIHRHAHVNTKPKGKYKHAKYYTVQPNDTLTSVSQKTGVPIATLETLNPTINVNSLQTGQSIRLRR